MSDRNDSQLVTTLEKDPTSVRPDLPVYVATNLVLNFESIKPTEESDMNPRLFSLLTGKVTAPIEAPVVEEIEEINPRLFSLLTGKVTAPIEAPVVEEIEEMNPRLFSLLTGKVTAPIEAPVVEEMNPRLLKLLK